MPIIRLGTRGSLLARSQAALVAGQIRDRHPSLQIQTVIVKTTGDGLLVDFASVVDAVACGVTIQRKVLERNAAVAEDKRLVFRIGINIGDIIVDGKDISATA